MAIEYFITDYYLYGLLGLGFKVWALGFTFRV
jgi:hypothetical protein